ncbi:hypothetical protein RI578_12225 [Streptomyces sp. BB1-1-1]|uniref:hypothetical protein n=1 Tax=Streptomyces sp. BB1-1-1 TaxID=3074430 RepID=UPI00287810D7|nr:hypothetical protein [Streptomyces sp. BB1-1-1]WND35001.1 hypothetical protein RI578_12225 [Streptomyces sp. BB1-1-1]
MPHERSTARPRRGHAAGVVHVRRQLRWDIEGRPYFWLPKGRKTREVRLPANLALRTRAHFRRFPSTSCTLPWRNPEAPTTALEERQRKPITVDLILTSSHGNRIYYRTWNDRSWKRALAAAGLIKPVGEKVRHDGDRIRRVPRYAARREDMFHVLRHTYASVQLEAGESVVSLSKWLGHSTPKVTLDHYAHFMPGAGQEGSPRWTPGCGIPTRRRRGAGWRSTSSSAEARLPSSHLTS